MYTTPPDDSMFSEERCGCESVINGLFLKCTRMHKHYGRHYTYMHISTHNNREYELQIYWDEIPKSKEVE